MKIGPVSGDLVVKLALLAGGAALAYLAWRKLTQGARDAGQAVAELAASAGEVVDSVIVGVNPANPENWANRGVTAAGSYIVSPEGPGRNADGSWTLGGAIFDLLNPGWATGLSGPTPLASSSSSSSSWGREARTAQVFDASSEELTPDYSQLSSLGAP